MSRLGFRCRGSTGRVEAATPGSPAFAFTCPAGSRQLFLSSPSAGTCSLGSALQVHKLGQWGAPRGPAASASLGFWSSFWGPEAGRAGSGSGADGDSGPYRHPLSLSQLRRSREVMCAGPRLEGESVRNSAAPRGARCLATASTCRLC